MHEEPTLPLGATPPQGIPQTPPARHAWGTFALLDRVGVGGFGEVYRAWDPHLQREVALKLLLPTAISGDAEYEAMLREARALASVRHPNIVPVYGIDRHDNRVGFWTDFVRGKTLSSLIGEQGTFGSREAALIGLDVTRALAAVHRAGILHRDIKAENVMREEGGRILLMDFGLSSLQQRQTNTAGTPSYMAPELFDGAPATVATDIYAMGVLLYFLVAGMYPANVTDISAQSAHFAIAERIPLMDVRPDVPESLLRTINTAMELDPAKRFASAGQLAEALTETLERPQTPPATGLATGSAISDHAAAKVRRRVKLLAAVAIAAALAVGLAAWSGALRRLIHPANSAVTPDTSSTTYDQYQNAQELLARSYKNANVSAAVQGFQQVLNTDPNFALAEAGLGAAYFLQYKDSHDAHLLEMAKSATNRAISLDKNVAPAYVTLARMAAMQGQTSIAMQQVQKALSIDGRSAEAYGALAEVYDAEGKSEDAVTAYQKAIDLAPEDARWPVDMGVDEFGMGYLDKAISHLQRGADLAKDNPIAYYDLGIANRQSGRLDEARKDMEASLKIEPDADTYAALGSLLLLEGKYDDAAAMDKKSIELNPKSYAAWGNLGAAYQWSGTNHDQAVQAFRKAIELAEEERTKDRNNAELLTALADNYASIGNAEQSTILIRKALALAPENPTVNYRAGNAYEILGDRAKAIQLIAKALAQGYQAYEFQRNPELAKLRADPGFIQALHAEKERKK
jgi:tetratricopeptide (TPR) repeat protein